MTPPKLRALVVDDEEPARDRLRLLLDERDDVEVVGEAEDGQQTIEQVEVLKPDVLFLDIQMPGCSGLEVAASLPSPRPAIVFCTAFDQFAVDAFELNVVDYLLKPVSRARLGQTLDRVRSRPRDAADAAVDGAGRSSGAPLLRLLGKHGTSHRVIPIQDVLYFGTEGGLTSVHTPDQHYWLQPTLSELEARLDPAHFFRISRAAIVRLDAVEEFRQVAGGFGEVRLRTGVRLEVSRRRVKPLTDRLGA